MNLYNGITVTGLKGKAIKAIAEKCGVSALSVKQNWIRMEEIPERHQDDTIKVLQNIHIVQTNYINGLKVI